MNVICLHCIAPTNRLLCCNVHRSAAVAISIQLMLISIHCSLLYLEYFDLFLVCFFFFFFTAVWLPVRGAACKLNEEGKQTS